MKIRSFSNEGQDILANLLIKEPGTFLDIGVGNCCFGSNTFTLEILGWSGLLVDFDQESVDRANRYRSSPAIQCDVRNADFRKILEAVKMPKMIDFISMDTDEANTDLVKNFPFDEYQFKILVFETDRYNNGDVRKRACEEALKPYPQYIKLLDDGMVKGLCWEDWIINKNYFDEKVIGCASSKMDWSEFLNKLSNR